MCFVICIMCSPVPLSKVFLGLSPVDCLFHVLKHLVTVLISISCRQCCVVLPMLCTTFWVMSIRLWRYLMTVCRSRHLTTTMIFCWPTALQLGAVPGGTTSAPSGVRPWLSLPGSAVATPPTTTFRMSAWCWSYSDRLASDGQLFFC